MENAKCKRRGVSNKYYLRKRPQKRTKKSKGKEDLDPLISTKHKCRKLAAQELIKEFLMKDGRGIDAQFFKEPKKDEFIGKGKTYFQKGKVPIPPGRQGKGVCGRKSCSAFEGSSSDTSQDFECSLSPISPPFTEVTRTTGEVPTRGTQLDLEKELQAFSVSYETAVGAQILAKLPENGVLEDALAALRELQGNRQDDEPLFTNEMEFLRRDDLEEEDFLLPKEPFCENFMEDPSDDLFIVENADHLPYLTAFDSGDEDRGANMEPRSEDFQEPVKELRITTPPIQFYRRNMF